MLIVVNYTKLRGGLILINRKLFLISLIIIFVAGLSAISATEIQDSDNVISNDQSAVVDDQDVVSDNKPVVNNYKSEVSNYKSEVIDNQSEDSNYKSEGSDYQSEDFGYQSEISEDQQEVNYNEIETPKTINKKNEINSKEAADSIADFDDLYSLITGDNTKKLSTKINDTLNKLHSSLNDVVEKYNVTFKKSNSSNRWIGRLNQKVRNVSIDVTIDIDNDLNITKIYGMGLELALNNTNLKIINSSYQSNEDIDLIISELKDPAVRELITNRSKDISSAISNKTKDISSAISNKTKDISSAISNKTKNITSIISDIANDIKSIRSDVDSIVSSFRTNVTVKVNPINGIIGENITLKARVTDVNGTPVDGGNLVFKLNGKTLKNNGRFDGISLPQKFKVEKGIVKVSITADLYLRNIKNLTASYSGSFKYNAAKSKAVTAQIKKRDAKISVTATPKTQKQYETITFTAKLKDITKGHKNNAAMSTNTKVLFKINGKTIKNILGRNLLVRVVNNTATYKYKVPAGMGGITKDGKTRKYTVTALLVSDTFYPDTRKNTTFGVQRSPITIALSNVKVTPKNKLSIQTSIKDYKGKKVIGNNSVAIKINGKTYTNPTTHKKQIFTVTNGKVNIKNIPVSEDIKIKNVMVVTGARQAYLGQRNQTSDIKKVWFVL